jgi:hypothetical protein
LVAMIMPLSQGDAAHLVDCLGRRELMPRDAAVYMAVLSLASPVDYKARVRARVIAGRLDMHEKHVISSISRLCKVKLLGRAYSRDGDPVLVLLSPSHGSPFPRCLDDVL